MGWPKGKPRKPKTVEPVVTSLEQIEVKEETPKPVNEGVVVSDKNSIEEMSISVTPGLVPALTNPQSDPFTRFKTETDKFAYRAINTKPMLRREREAQGWQTIPGSEYGDLVLAKIPKDIDAKIKHSVNEKTKRQSEAVKANFKEQAAQSGVKTFEEK